MADREVESSKNTEIGEFKTPEELALALEEKSNKELAKRVRDISCQVQDDSCDLRKKLQDELTPTEQKEIRETLPNSGVGKVFTKGMTKDEIESNAGKAVIAGVVGEETAENLEKAESYSKNFSDAMDVAGKLFDEGKWIAAIGVFFKGLFGKFSLKDWDKKDEEKKEEGKDGEKNEGEKINENTKYRGLSALFTNIIYSGENKNNVVNILNSPKIEEIKIKDIPNLLKKENLKKELFDGTNYNEEEIKHTLKMFSEGKGKNILDNYYKNGYGEKTIKEVILGIKDLNVIEEINNKIANTEISDITKIGTILGNGLSLDVKNENGAINQKAHDLGINQDIISGFLSFNWNINGKDSKEFINKNVDSSNIENKEKTKEIINFGYSFIENLKTNKKINLGFDKISDGIRIQPKDILKLYILTGGQKDFNFDQLNDFQQSFIYISVLGILDKEDDQLQAEYFTRLAGISLDKGSDYSNLVPEGVKNIIGSSMNVAEDVIKNKAKELGYEIVGSIKEHPQILLWILGVISVVGWNVRKVPFIEIPLWIGKKIIRKILK